MQQYGCKFFLVLFLLASSIAAAFAFSPSPVSFHTSKVASRHLVLGGPRRFAVPTKLHFVTRRLKEEEDLEILEQQYQQAYQHREEILLRAKKEAADAQEEAKFGFAARIESIKCVAVGALAGGIALAPASLIRDVVLNHQRVAQWEFDTDMGSLEAALFAIVYRYCIREDTNPQLKDGVVGAFVLTRLLSRVQVPEYCSAVPLDCKYKVIVHESKVMSLCVLLIDLQGF